MPKPNKYRDISLEGIGKIYKNKFYPAEGTCFSIQKLKFILQKMEEKFPYYRLRKLPLEELLKQKGKEKWKIWAKKKLYVISLRNERMLLMLRSQKCACCGLQATHLWLEHSGCRSPHLNMYAGETMLTADHILPKSAGGLTTRSNLQTLCQSCNSLKGNRRITLKELREELRARSNFPVHSNDEESKNEKA